MQLLKILFLVLALAMPARAATTVITRGETPTLTIYYQTETGAAFPITGATITMDFKKKDGTLLTKTISISSGSGGIGTLTMTANDTNSLKVGTSQTVKSTVTISGVVSVFWFDNSLDVRINTL